MAPSDNRDRDEGDRPSWRDIDRRRDRSRHVSRDESSGAEKSLRSPRAKKQYLKEAEKLFQGAKGTKEHKKALDAIHRHYGTGKFAGSVRKYLKTYGLPTDWSTLLLLLDFKEDKVVVEVIEAMKALLCERKPIEREGFKNKLEIISFTSSSTRLTSLAERVLGEV